MIIIFLKSEIIIINYNNNYNFLYNSLYKILDLLFYIEQFQFHMILYKVVKCYLSIYHSFTA